MTGKTIGERMAAVEAWQTGHEQACTDRQVSMGREIRELKNGVDGLNKGAWGVVLALLAWSLVQIYDGMKPAPRGPVTIVAAAPK